MSATLDEMAKRKPAAEVSTEQQAAAELVRMAKEKGLSLTGPDGLLKMLTKSVIETALSEEMTDHLGYEKRDPAGIGAENIRNGTRSKTVISGHTGPVEIDVPRDRAGTFEPQIVKKRQRRLGERARARSTERGWTRSPNRCSIASTRSPARRSGSSSRRCSAKATTSSDIL
jgi:putative transposase